MDRSEAAAIKTDLLFGELELVVERIAPPGPSSSGSGSRRFASVMRLDQQNSRNKRGDRNHHHSVACELGNVILPAIL